MLVLVAFITANSGLPPWTWIEKSRFVAKAEAALDTITTPAVPSDINGEIFTYTDGWIVLLYGQSRTTGHNMWNYNLAKDSTGQEYLCEQHFCQTIRTRYDMRIKSDESYLKSNPGTTSVPNLPDPDFDHYKSMIEARSLTDALRTLTTIGFTKR